MRPHGNVDPPEHGAGLRDESCCHFVMVFVQLPFAQAIPLCFRSEHKLVLDALQSLEPERKCYRLVGGVLVERTAAEVRPAVGSNVEGCALYQPACSGQGRWSSWSSIG